MTNSDDCQSYLTHLHSEHDRLELLSKKVIDRFRQSRDDRWEKTDRPEIAAQLSALNDELSKHIAEEDQGGCLDEAVARLPSLSHSAKKIYQENDQLQTELRRVMQLVEFGSRTESETAFREFAADLRLHERHEEQLVKKGLNRLADVNENRQQA